MATGVGLAVPEVAPLRLDVHDTAGIKASLSEHGYACIKEAAAPDELEHARDLLWAHLQGEDCPLQTQTRPVGWQRGVPETWVEGHGDGLMTSTTHCDCLWYVRSLPGVVAGFRAAYDGEPIVSAYDRMSINLPTSTGNAASLRVAGVQHEHGKLNASGLHTHFNQDGHGEELICYAILPLWDMNRATGATAIVPGSHKKEKVEAINAMRDGVWKPQEKGRKWVGPGTPETFLEPFSANGLTPCVTNVTAGDLVLFDTGMFHAGCAAEDPTGHSGEGPDQLLRAICIMSACPTRLITGTGRGPEILAARRRAYELDLFTGGSAIRPEQAGQLLEQYGLEASEEHPNVREFRDAPPMVQHLIDPSMAPEPRAAKL